MHASQRRQCMSIAFRRSVGFISSLLIGGQASPFMDKSKRIRQTSKKAGRVSGEQASVAVALRATPPGRIGRLLALRQAFDR